MLLTHCRMALRNFTARDGKLWMAWLVYTGSTGVLPGMPNEWLAFQSEDGQERLRLLPFPETWEDLPDDRLDLLRRTAEPVARIRPLHSPPAGVEAQKE